MGGLKVYYGTWHHRDGDELGWLIGYRDELGTWIDMCDGPFATKEEAERWAREWTDPAGRSVAMHVNPLYSDGNFTVGYDDDGIAGQWPGNMVSFCEKWDFIPAQEHHVFWDGNEAYHIERRAQTLYWVDEEGNAPEFDV